MKQIKIYDTTLRDGTQSEEINLSVQDKVRITRKLDDLGVHYVEGGWPGSNATDKEFFQEIQNYALKNIKVSAFGSTHMNRLTPENDPNLNALIESGAKAMSIFGKTWDFHATSALGVTLERNIELISNSIGYLRPHVEELFFDAEHFFDGFKANPEFTISCLKAAYEAGADVLVLCDTNGGSMPEDVAEACRVVQEKIPGCSIGIHAHNDCELAVANSLAAVKNGAIQIQGTMNGYGERCGNANLCSIIPNLELKLGYETIGKDKLIKLKETSTYVTEIANLRPFLRQPFVGQAAFAHKGGIHVSAVLKDSTSYEHIDPLLVGNDRRVLLSDLSGKSNVLYKAKQYGYDLDKNDPAVQTILADIKERESIGFEYSAAEASFELLFFKAMGWSKRYFEFINFFVVDAKRKNDQEPFSEATVIVKVHGEENHTAASGDGPVNALDKALRKALEPFYPSLKDVRLQDFKVRVLSGAVRQAAGTSSNVRLLIESTDGKSQWTTMGVSHNIIEASWQALVDSINYKLFKDDPQKWPSR
ncbi:citramalate synthase [Desulfovibrio sp. JC010]|uniref:citramalate synthase n=1 Tax=Desulfovibrio sp. JC010 TaxID=2593641 RepID=UPI0013D49161|nr:citramalate synthase [Desulfovibrio sp. JC010]NDV28002.1 citramalate synthase [Desulfovibrio sp. JC010]